MHLLLDVVSIVVSVTAFYVNRGQAIASFGTQNKDGGIMKFSTANVAYQQTPNTGFRTFLKGSRSPTSRRLGKIHKDATRSDTIGIVVPVNSNLLYLMGCILQMNGSTCLFNLQSRDRSKASPRPRLAVPMS